MAQKKIYKIYDIKKGKYHSTGKKNSWTSKNWAEQAIETLCFNRSGYVYFQLKQEAKIELLKNYEIHEFELVMTSSYSAAAKLIDNAEIKEKIAVEEKQINEIKRELNDAFNHLKISSQILISYYEKGILNNELNNAIMKGYNKVKEDTIK